MQRLRNTYSNFYGNFVQILTWMIVGIGSVCIFVGGMVQAQVPTSFYANYQIQSEWDNILDTFVQLEAQKRIGQDPPPVVFSQLANNFQTVFPQLPQESSYQIVYQQCRLLSQDVANGYTYDKFINFMENCYTPLNRTIREIGNRYTMEASVVANPSQGPAPLTVTFDAKGSTDPSNDTIPQSNYYRYFKDIDGIDKVIGQGPTVNYTFEQEGSYIVHLTVRSANQGTEGILDGSTTIPINVSAASANIVVYLDGLMLSPEVSTKIGTQAAQRGVTLDGSATQARGGRSILSHQRTVTQQSRTIYQSDIIQGSPATVNTSLPGDGAYTVTLSVNDNENNSYSKEFLVNVSDPVAIVTNVPEQGDTQTNFSFDASASYSIASSLRLYTREIFDETGERIFTTQQKQISRTFTQPGTYRVKLTVQDELGQVDENTISVSVESSPPQAQFSIEPTSERQYPSQFLLDARATRDIDVNNNVDALSYEWILSDPENSTISPLQEGDMSRVLLAFDSIGEQSVTLVATDSYGQSNRVSRDISVESGLRPRIIASTQATQWGNPISFAGVANKDIINYQWDFGNGTERITQNSAVEYTYDQAGVYQISLTTNSTDGDENTITSQVFIGEQDQPIIAYKALDENQNIMKQDAVCTDENGEERTSYQIERQADFTLDISDSVNTEGGSNNLESFFSPQNGEIFATRRFGHTFREVGCTYIEITLEDTETTVQERQRVWFKVVNALPNLDNLTLFFPQFGNEIGVGLNQNNVENIFDSDEDQLIVKVIAQNASDMDGQISTFTWYYYNKDDPNRLLEVKANPGNVPYAFFTLSKSALQGEYAFGVRMTDNDGGEITSEQIIGFGPSLFFLPQGNQNIDIPIVTLKSDAINSKVGEEINFEVVARILSNRPDFIATRTIEYDFGDGTPPFKTKQDNVTHIYEKAGNYTPSARVIYRGNPGVAYGESINVQNALKTNILVTTYDDTVLIRDASMGQITDASVCFDRRRCNTPGYTQSNQGEYIFSYPEYGQYVIEYQVSDEFGNNATERRIITLEPISTDIPRIVSLPEIDRSLEPATIRVGNALNNQVLLYIAYDGPGECYVDINIARDDDGDGVNDNDQNMICGIPKRISYTPELGETQARIYYEQLQDNTPRMVSKDFIVDFIDYQTTLSEEEKELYFTITQLINSIDDSLLGNAIIKDELTHMRENLQNDAEVSLAVLAIQEYRNDPTIVDKQISLTQQQEDQLAFILQQVETSITLGVQGASIYEQSKQKIIETSPNRLQPDIRELFARIDQLPEPAKEQEIVRDNLQTILSVLVEDSQSQQPDSITQEKVDLEIVPEICRILDFYAIPSELCGNQENTESLGSQANQAVSGGLVTILRWIGIVVLILGGGFLLIVLFFAIKSRLKNKSAA